MIELNQSPLKMKNEKSLQNLGNGRILLYGLFFALVFTIPLIVGIKMIYNSPSEILSRELQNMEVVAYNEHSFHILGNENYTNPTFKNWNSIFYLEYPGNGFFFKNHYRQGVRAVAISYKHVEDYLEKKTFEVYYEPFQFDESGLNSVIQTENGWTTERYNLVKK